MLLRPLRACAVALAVTAALGAAPAAAATPAPTPTPKVATATGAAPTPQTTAVGPVPTPTGSPTVPARAAAEIAADIARQQQALTADQARLAAAGAQAIATLQAYQLAQRAADIAERQARDEAAKLVLAVRRTVLARAQFERYVGSLYRTGMADPRMMMVSAALSAPDSKAFFGGLGLADQVGTAQSRAINDLADAQAAQNQQSLQAGAAQAVQHATAAQALLAKAAADKVVAIATAQVTARTATLAQAQGALAFAQAREAMLAKAEAIAQQRSGAPAAAVAGAAAVAAAAASDAAAIAGEAALAGPGVVRPFGACLGGDVRGYPNGMLPTDALCPLWGTAGQVLQADAASAFDALSHEYAAQFAAPICVTDSYRDFAAQVAVKILKPSLAATPGRSNHGWGVAVDLCDGIERFDTPTHAWMVANAMRFGWFHPSWAEPTGAKPEAWHWEYAGALLPPAAPAPVVVPDLSELQRQLQHR